ncbi:hypothetical protein Glove_269g19 [Diversispora epigaea]|uniref:Uncharacterized protein n=1 Tax=Diversispora epigaea TaxID=1348612 RepID=A0A397IB79_9GLOM|nr:hypothetical protein Glove_269g19 [Diversispora epigaea]
MPKIALCCKSKRTRKAILTSSENVKELEAINHVGKIIDTNSFTATLFDNDLWKSRTITRKNVHTTYYFYNNVLVLSSICKIKELEAINHVGKIIDTNSFTATLFDNDLWKSRTITRKNVHTTYYFYNNVLVLSSICKSEQILKPRLQN